MKSNPEPARETRAEAPMPRPVARAAQNAWRHGLTVPPTDVDEEVVAMCRLIAGDGEHAALQPSRWTVDLARAEVQFRRVRRGERAAIDRLSSLITSGEVVGTPAERGYRALLKSFNVSDKILDDPGHAIHALVQISGNLPALDPVTVVLEELRLMVRYRQEAEAWRRSALSAWLDAEDEVG